MRLLAALHNRTTFWNRRPCASFHFWIFTTTEWKHYEPKTLAHLNKGWKQKIFHMFSVEKNQTQNGQSLRHDIILQVQHAPAA